MKAGLKLESVDEELVETPEFEEEMQGMELVKKAPALLQAKRLIEAALFQANRALSFKELSEVLGGKEYVPGLLHELKSELDASDSAITLSMTEDKAFLEVKPDYLEKVAFLSKQTELSRKATRILALIGKKGQLLQSELKNYFRGEIYAYIAELKDFGYIEATKQGATRLLKPSKKFFDTFQLTA
ncbi:SMC-Scp complex subunit ScpB [Candidatus Micrarchaeota archaeon]|nr:SMC-Scp complex subunit ScpB [Candidatus Micrarchaeota archaeon]